MTNATDADRAKARHVYEANIAWPAEQFINAIAAALAEARAEERERCAKIADERAAMWSAQAWQEDDTSCALSLAEECEDIAAFIRKGDSK